ncbi:MAG: LytTR family DNA-binding domain-containing protein [Lachnospiraceae bacterium]|nr:LytTR family DNA-binding domain-containing protein [Lachnospiraceae bacterium]
MLQIGICDDETLLLDEIKRITDDCLQKQQTFSVLSTYTDGKMLLYDIQDGKHFDLLLLDIEMPDISGMELAHRIHELLPDSLMIFVTAHYKYAVDAYALHIFRYIPKNQLMDRLPHALKDAVSLLEIQNTDSYIISSQNRLERIPLKEILFIEKDGKNAVFHTTMTGNRTEDPTENQSTPTRRIRKTLTEVFDELHSEEFYFIERGFIVNLRHVSGISRTDCILTDQTHLPISQSRLPEFKKKLNRYWKNKI